MVKNVLFGNSLGHPESSKREDKGGGRAHCSSLTTMRGAERWGITDMVLVVCLSQQGKILEDDNGNYDDNDN
jgi:hypothetical protein